MATTNLLKSFINYPISKLAVVLVSACISCTCTYIDDVTFADEFALFVLQLLLIFGSLRKFSEIVESIRKTFGQYSKKFRKCSTGKGRKYSRNCQ